MVTLVGTQQDFIKALQELLELEYVASETYEAAINRLEQEEFKKALIEFKSDHQRHIEQLNNLLEQYGAEIPQGPSGKQIMTIGKIAISQLFGDKSILQAMKDAEDDTNKAYERMLQHPEKPKDCEDILNQALADERRHREWIERTIDQL